MWKRRSFLLHMNNQCRVSAHLYLLTLIRCSELSRKGPFSSQSPSMLEQPFRARYDHQHINGRDTTSQREEDKLFKKIS